MGLGNDRLAAGTMIAEQTVADGGRREWDVVVVEWLLDRKMEFE
jgi:hypothetical protein